MHKLIIEHGLQIWLDPRLAEDPSFLWRWAFNAKMWRANYCDEYTSIDVQCNGENRWINMKISCTGQVIMSPAEETSNGTVVTPTPRPIIGNGTGLARLLARLQIDPFYNCVRTLVKRSKGACVYFMDGSTMWYTDEFICCGAEPHEVSRIETAKVMRVMGNFKS